MGTQNPIDALLEAEREAEAEIERHRTGARKTINDALEQARRISERADARTRDIHTKCAAAVKAETERMWQAYEQEPATALEDMATPVRLQRVVARVAAKLTGTKPIGAGNHAARPCGDGTGEGDA